MVAFNLYCNLRQGWCYCDGCPKSNECGGWFDNDLREDKYFRLSNKIAVYRHDLGLSQTDLGKMCGLSQNTISSLENGIYKPTLYSAMKIAHALGTTIDQLFHLEYFPRA